MWCSRELEAFIEAFDMSVPKQRLSAMAHNMKQIQDRAEHLAADPGKYWLVLRIALGRKRLNHIEVSTLLPANQHGRLRVNQTPVTSN